MLVRERETPIAGASVRSGSLAARTDANGVAALRLASGLRLLVVASIGFHPESLSVAVRPDLDTLLVADLEPVAAELESVVVTTTRSERRIESTPLRVEVIGREEIEEKLLMTPGDVAMLLNETGGLRVVTSAPSLGGATVRIQGLRGRYTLLLTDGLPLYGGQTGALGLLQIPPMDLARLEIIKGVASALYGAAALGGVVNLVTRRPGPEAETEVLLNQTTRNGSDVVLWTSRAPTDRWGYTFLGSLHRQSRQDVDGEGWTDVAGYRRAVLRPRVLWTFAGGGTASFTSGLTLERRGGGTLPGFAAPDGFAYPESLTTRRHDAGAVLRLPLGAAVLAFRGAAAIQHHGHRFGSVRERDRHETWFVEIALAAARGRHTGVAGVALERTRYVGRDVTKHDFTFTVPASFAQYEVELSASLVMSASARLDAHSEFGTFVSPRVSALLRGPGDWTLRASGGTGAFAPTPFTEETEVTGLTPVRQLTGLRAEQAQSGSLDLGGTVGPFEVNATLFGSRIAHPLQARAPDGAPRELELVNAVGSVHTVGADGLVRLRVRELTTTVAYTWIRSTEPTPDRVGRRRVPLTPRHSAGLVSVWEPEGRGRVGVEVYYTGRQPLEENPYRGQSRPYVVIGAIGEWRFGPVRAVLNLENLGDVRMTRDQPLVRPDQGAGGRWTTDVWAPLEGRVINGGLRLSL